MRDMLDTLTCGPFRDDTHRAAVEAAADDLGPKSMAGGVYEAPELRRAAEKYRQALVEPVGGKIKSDGRVIMVEAEDGRVRASYAAESNMPRPRHVRAAEIGAEIIESDGRFIRQAVAQIYDAAIEIAATAGPLPLRAFPRDVLDWLDGPGDDGGSPAWHRAVLDASAALYPDLVPATTMHGEP